MQRRPTRYRKRGCLKGRPYTETMRRGAIQWLAAMIMAFAIAALPIAGAMCAGECAMSGDDYGTAVATTGESHCHEEDDAADLIRIQDSGRNGCDAAAFTAVLTTVERPQTSFVAAPLELPRTPRVVSLRRSSPALKASLLFAGPPRGGSLPLRI